MLRKPLNELTSSDILALIERGATEDTALEFKRALATKDGADDPWIRGGKVGTNAKRDLIKELVAFANTDGGTLVLGVGEDGQKRATSYNAIPECRTLADCLGASLIEAADPSLTSLQSVGIELDGGSGVVVFRVPPSHLAPHRAKDDMQCYVRQGDCSVPMSMRQVRDLAVARASSLQQVERALEERKEQFQFNTRFGVRVSSEGGTLQACLVGVRASAVPLERISIDDLSERKDFHLCRCMEGLSFNGIKKPVPFPAEEPWTPILRGIKAQSNGEGGLLALSRIIRRDGLIEVVQIRPDLVKYNIRGVTPNAVLWTFAQLLVMVECVRALLGRPELPFALDFDWRFNQGTGLLVHDLDAMEHRSHSALAPDNRVSDHEMPTRDGLNGFWNRLQVEFLGSFGLTREYVSSFDFHRAVSDALPKDRGL